MTAFSPFSVPNLSIDGMYEANSIMRDRCICGIYAYDESTAVFHKEFVDLCVLKNIARDSDSVWRSLSEM
jgi:hypothetical protein